MKTVRRHNGQACVGLRASLTRGDLDEQAQAIAEAYVQWESQPLTLANGTRMSSGYVLWLPESQLVQPSTDGLLSGDTPLLREPLPPDLDLRALPDDLDPQIDHQPPIVAEPLPPARRRRRNAGPPRKKTTTYKGVTRIDRDAGRHSDGRRISATHGSMERVLRATCAVSRSRPCDDRLASVPSVRWRINGTKL